MQKTLIIIKPDACERDLVGEILKSYEEENLKIVTIKSILATKDIAEKHYAEHKDKPFFSELITYITRSKVIVAELQGEDAVSKARKINSVIRNNYSLSTTENCVHGSDSVDSAIREISIWF